MYIFRKPSKRREQLARKQMIEHREKRTCPGCSGQLELIEAGKDRSSYRCEKCGALCTFTASIPEVKKSKETKLNLITIRDRSKKDPGASPDGQVDLDAEEIQATLEVVRESMHEKRLLTFVYVGRDGRKSSRTIEPYKLSLDGSGNPILYGFCTESEGTRMFKLTKMFKLEIQAFTFKPKWDMEDRLDKSKDNR